MTTQDLIISKWEGVITRLVLRQSSLSLGEVHSITVLLFDTLVIVQDPPTRARLRLLFDTLRLRQPSKNGRRH